MPTKKTDDVITISPVQTETIRVAILGTRPIILNRLAEKARRELLLPAGRKTAADRAANLKHDPLSEYQASPYRLPNDDDPTLLAVPASAFKKAMMTAALDLPGARKAQIGRLLWVEGDLVPIYGVPNIFCAITRSADINRTPDVRTRAIVPQWATQIDVTFARPLLDAHSVLNLLAAAGMICGVGDWRTEKGAGTFGAFTLTEDDDDAFAALLANGGRAVQTRAMADPEPYDAETDELWGWFRDELTRRGKVREIKHEEAAD